MKMWLRAACAALIVALVGGVIAQSVPLANAAPRAALSDSLVAYWNMDETSGVRADAVGANDLSDNNTVGYAAGKISNASDFVASNTEYLSIADNADLSLGSQSFSFAGWMYPHDLTGDKYLFARDDAGTSTRDYAVRTYGSYFYFVVYTGANVQICAAQSAISLNTWQFVVATYNETNDTCSVSVNNGSVSSNNGYSGSGNNSDTNAPLYVGMRQDGNFIYDGLLDEWGFWKRELTSGEITALYNAGAGCAHPFTSCEATATPTATNTPIPPTATSTPTATFTPPVIIVITATPIDTPTPRMDNYIWINDNAVGVVERGGSWFELADLFLSLFQVGLMMFVLIKWWKR